MGANAVDSRTIRNELIARDLPLDPSPRRGYLNAPVQAGDIATGAVTTAEVLNETILSEDIVDGSVHVYENPNEKIEAESPAQEAAEVEPSLHENGFRDVTSSPYSTFSIDVDNASYTNVRNYLNHGEPPPASAVRIEEMINYFHYDYPQPTDHHPFVFNSETVTCPWDPNHRLVRLALQGREIDRSQGTPNNLVFLIDVSGSMDSDDKLPLLKKSFERLINNLGQNDMISIVVYAGAAGLVLEPTPASDRGKILRALNQLSAGGSTAGGAGIELAYATALKNYRADGNNRVILATDGDFNVGVSSQKGLTALIEEKRSNGIYLSVLGFGRGNYQDGKMESLADHGNGNYYYIDQLKEAERVLSSGMTGTLYTIAKDVKLQIIFNPESVAAYRLIGYENRVLAARDFNDDTKDAGDLGAGHQVTALYEIVPKGSPVGHDFDTTGTAEYNLDEEIPTFFTSNDLFLARLRYKKPADSVSMLIEHLAKNDQKEITTASESTRLAVSVAAWGMLLRGSHYVGTLDYTPLQKWLSGFASASDATTPVGELAGLVHQAATMDVSTSKELGSR